MRLRYWLWVGLLFLLAAPAVAERRYILCGPTALATAPQEGLTVVRALPWPNRSCYLVTAADSLPPSQVIQSVKSHSAAHIELDGAVVLPEASGIQLNQSTVGILDALTDPTSVTYGSGTVWAGYVNQTAAQIIRTADAHQLATGSPSGPLAVIDTGVDPTHPGLSGVLVPGYDFTRNLVGGSELADLDQSTVAILDQSSTSMVDKTIAIVNQSTVAILDQSTVAILDTSALPAAFGHGTMVAGLIHLAAPTSPIMPLKAFTGAGTSTVVDITSAVYYAVAHGAKGINMSFSMDVSSDELLAAISYATSKRVICVASAGNSGLQTIVYPAGWKKVSGVASTANSDLRSLFSNYGSNLVSFAAPGEAVFTFYPYNNYAAVWGTSFSAPQASGGVGLLLQIDANINQDQAAASLSQAAKPLLGQGLGAGRIDLYGTLQYWLAHKSK